jgi:TPR repeat protein
LGLCFSEGKGVNKDLVAAMRWFQEAADLGHAEAWVRLAALQPPAHSCCVGSTATATAAVPPLSHVEALVKDSL